MEKLEIKIDPNAINWNKLKELIRTKPITYDEALWALKDLGILSLEKKKGCFWAKLGSGVDVSPTGAATNQFYFYRQEDCQNYISAFFPKNDQIQPAEIIELFPVY